MDRRTAQLKKRLSKKAKRGFRGYPICTIAFYGPDDSRASKLVASIVEAEDAEPTSMEKWYSEQDDVRDLPDVVAETIAFLEEHGALSIGMTGRIIGCPHEEGIDYDGEVCPQCPYWANRDRWTGEIIQ